LISFTTSIVRAMSSQYRASQSLPPSVSAPRQLVRAAFHWLVPRDAIPDVTPGLWALASPVEASPAVDPGDDDVDEQEIMGPESAIEKTPAVSTALFIVSFW
jgi:hypothetical protein